MNKPGESAWNEWEGRDTLVSLCHGDTELAELIHRVYGSRSLEALDEGAPAFEGARPRKLLKDKKGRQKLRRALLKFPYL